MKVVLVSEFPTKGRKVPHETGGICSINTSQTNLITSLCFGTGMLENFETPFKLTLQFHFGELKICFCMVFVSFLLA